MKTRLYLLLLMLFWAFSARVAAQTAPPFAVFDEGLIDKIEGPNMLVDGVNSSSEALTGNDALASHETCDISDYTWTVGYYLMATGDATLRLTIFPQYQK